MAVTPEIERLWGDVVRSLKEAEGEDVAWLFVEQTILDREEVQ